MISPETRSICLEGRRKRPTSSESKSKLSDVDVVRLLCLARIDESSKMRDDGVEYDEFNLGDSREKSLEFLNLELVASSLGSSCSDWGKGKADQYVVFEAGGVRGCKLTGRVNSLHIIVIRSDGRVEFGEPKSVRERNESRRVEFSGIVPHTDKNGARLT